MSNRLWRIDFGRGNHLILVLTRKDYQPLSYNEWETTLLPFQNKAHFIIIDIVEKCFQENSLFDFTIKDLSEKVYLYLKEQSIYPDMIWGFSMGGMIAQELRSFSDFTKTPLLLISTNLYATPKLKAVFSSWFLSLKSGGIENFYRTFLPWIISSNELPIFYMKDNIIINNSTFGIKKLAYSIKAVSKHNACNTLKNNYGKILILFGENSTLLNHEEAIIFKKYVPNIKIHFVKNASMRVMSCLDNITFNIINNYIDSLEDTKI